MRCLMHLLYYTCNHRNIRTVQQYEKYGGNFGTWHNRGHPPGDL